MKSCRCLIVMMLLPLFVMGLGGCANTPDARFYVLTPLPGAKANSPLTVAPSNLSLGVGPITLPAYLDRPQIVTRASQAKLDLSEFEQWAAPLQDDVPRVLAENLSHLIPTDHVTVFPWQRSTPIDYQITVDITRFEGRLGESSALIARWRILGEDGRELLMKTSSFSEQANGQDHEATVASMSRTLVNLSREIAAAIQNVGQRS